MHDQNRDGLRNINYTVTSVNERCASHDQCSCADCNSSNNLSSNSVLHRVAFGGVPYTHLQVDF